MDQDTRWLTKYYEVMDFMETNHRNPSKPYDEEKLKYHWVKHTKKQLNQGLLKPESVEIFNKLLVLAEQYKRKNQYQ